MEEVEPEYDPDYVASEARLTRSQQIQVIDLSSGENSPFVDDESESNSVRWRDRCIKFYEDKDIGAALASRPAYPLVPPPTSPADRKETRGRAGQDAAINTPVRTSQMQFPGPSPTQLAR